VRKTAILLIMLGVLVLSMASAGCNEKEEVTATTPTIAPTATQPAISTATPKQTITPSISPASTAITLFLTVTQPLDGAQVNTNSILVAGATSPGAVVSVLVNDEVMVADVDQNGNFSVAVSLEEGPNFIEVIASDQHGNEKSTVLAVLYVS